MKDANPAPDAPIHQVAFLPWLRLRSAQHVAGVNFVPLHDSDGTTSSTLVELVGPLGSILASYVDRKGQSIDSCVVATISGRSWDLSNSDFSTVKWAAALLFLASWACNEYFPRWPVPYVNSSPYRVVWHRFSGTPTFVTLVSRRRDGRNWDGGYKLREVKFTVPLQCSLREPAEVDGALLKALDAGNAVSCETLRRLRSALSFVNLANTDDELMDEPSEAILMGSAFEQLLSGDASSYKLGRKFGCLFRPYGRVTVDEARRIRPDIRIDTSRPERADAQLRWWVHRKWAEDLYNVRSKVVHEGTSAGCTWGWALHEHLVMAAWVFPLAVKLLLERDGHYTPTGSDKARCLSIDKLLAANDWDEETEGGTGPSRWHEIVATTARKYDFNQRMAQFHEGIPQVLGDSGTEGSAPAENTAGVEPV